MTRRIILMSANQQLWLWSFRTTVRGLRIAFKRILWRGRKNNFSLFRHCHIYIYTHINLRYFAQYAQYTIHRQPCESNTSGRTKKLFSIVALQFPLLLCSLTNNSCCLYGNKCQASFCQSARSCAPKGNWFSLPLQWASVGRYLKLHPPPATLAPILGPFFLP